MKTSLTKEQHEKLHKLGVECVSANELAFLIEMLPKQINVDGTIFYLNICAYTNCWDVWYCDDENRFIGNKEKQELIDAIFELVVWCIENEHIETNKK